MNQFARPGLGATELPPVSADDNGKVLGVSDGAWAKVAASGGSDLPDDPAQDGTYNLQNTVSSGTSTLSWAGGSSGGGVLVVHETVTISGNTTIHTLDKTWQEIHDADFAVLKMDNGMIYYACGVGVAEEEFYYVGFMYNHPAEDGYFCDSASGYPSYTQGK